MKCNACDVTTPLFRQNEKGVEGIWACLAHSKAAIDPEVKEITDIVSGQNNDAPTTNASPGMPGN